MTAIRQLEGIAIQKNGVTFMMSPETFNFVAGSSFEARENPAGTAEITYPPSKSMLFYNGGNQSLAVNLTRYITFGTALGFSATDIYRMPMNDSGILSNLYVAFATNVLTAGIVITILKNGNPTALTVSLANGEIAKSDTTHTVTYVAGDQISIQWVSGNGSGSATGLAVSLLNTLSLT